MGQPELACRTNMPRGCFGPGSRVRKRTDYRRIQATGERVHTQHCLFLIAGGNAGQAGAKLGITATRRVGCAVVRNRAKRLVREAFRATRDVLWRQGIDVVVIVRKIDPQLKRDDLVNEWLGAALPLGRAAKRVAGRPQATP